MKILLAKKIVAPKTHFSKTYFILTDKVFIEMEIGMSIFLSCKICDR